MLNNKTKYQAFTLEQLIFNFYFFKFSTSVTGVHGSQKMALGSLERESSDYLVVSHHVCAENWTWIF